MQGLSVQKLDHISLPQELHPGFLGNAGSRLAYFFNLLVENSEALLHLEVDDLLDWLRCCPIIENFLVLEPCLLQLLRSHLRFLDHALFEIRLPLFFLVLVLFLFKFLILLFSLLLPQLLLVLSGLLFGLKFALFQFSLLLLLLKVILFLLLCDLFRWLLPLCFEVVDLHLILLSDSLLLLLMLSNFVLLLSDLVVPLDFLFLFHV